MRFAGITQGRTESEQNGRLARVVRTVHPGGTVLDTHAHDGACFTLVLRGGFVEEGGGQLIRSGPGTLLFRPAFEPHRNRYGRRGCRSVLIELTLDDVEPQGIRLPHAPRQVIAPAAVRLALEIGQPTSYPPYAETEADNAVLELAAIAFDEASRPASRSRRPSPAWLRRVYDRIAGAPHDLPSIGALASTEGMHVDHLIRAFYAAYGETPGVFARRLRTRAAARRIRTGSRSLASIAAASGYADQSHMTRELRRFLGTTPGEIRRPIAEPKRTSA